MKRFVLLLVVGLACGDDDPTTDAAADADVADAGEDARLDTGPACELSCGFGEDCCVVDGSPVCLDTRSDVANCGGCGIDCRDGRGTACERGLCVCGSVDVGCGGNRNSWCCPPSGEEPVDYCANFDQDSGDCGECGEACDPTRADRCDGGRCLCGERRTQCEGTAESTCCAFDVSAGCTDLTSDESHCGACNNRCTLRERCESAVCTVGDACPAGCGAAEVCCGGACCARAICDGSGQCRDGADAGVDAGPDDAGPDDAGPDDGGGA